ncbi:MAG: polysaccharide deacetylase family protein [Burkholderiales bacterium]
MKLALKVDVPTLRGTRDGVPRLLELLQKHRIQASFFFNLGPNSRFFPGPETGRLCAAILQRVSAAGHEAGIHAYNSSLWKHQAAQADALWTQAQMRQASERFGEIFKDAPRIHGAPDWQMNLHAFRLTQRLGFDYGCDTRGTCPFVPIVRAEIIACPQLPTTLPTLDEALASKGKDGALQYLLKLTENPPPTGHIYTLRAEREGRKLAPLFELLIEGWRRQGYALTTTRTLFEALETKHLPRHEVAMSKLPGSNRMQMLQTREFLAG